MTQNTVLLKAADLDLTVPDSAIQGSIRAELKIYPNLMAHVIDSIDGILHRPYGCAEQSISSTYPSLMLLGYLQRVGRQDHPLEGKARRYLQSGLDRLLGYRDEDGGFTYWGRGDADVNLTAYALTFLKQAKEFVAVDERLIETTRTWLLKRQEKTGEWVAHSWNHQADNRGTLYQTAEVVLALAGTDSQEGIDRALEYLSHRAGNIDEPYLIAAVALAAQDAGDSEVAGEMLGQLRKLVRREESLAYWNLESNTPFYGWGLAGRLETTALAVRAFAASGQDSDNDLIASGLLFLLQKKDHYGVWRSTQATVKVLEAILVASAREGSAGNPGPVVVSLNDHVVESLPMPSPRELTGPIRFDISRYLIAGANRVTVGRAQAGSQAQVQLAATYYVPWTIEPVSPEGSQLHFRVSFAKTALQLGDAVSCTVETERVGFRGYGMMLAEIGLPPGAEVERQSLDAAMSASGYALGSYDILPDRVVAYVWPTAGGTKFKFRFRPRFAIHAKSAPSLLYDYYNPDANVVVAPVNFSVQSADVEATSAGN